MGVYLESLGTGLPKLQSDNFLPGGMGTVSYNPRNFPRQQTCAHSAQLTLQGHMLDHRQIRVTDFMCELLRQLTREIGGWVLDWYGN